MTKLKNLRSFNCVDATGKDKVKQYLAVPYDIQCSFSSVIGFKHLPGTGVTIREIITCAPCLLALPVSTFPNSNEVIFGLC
jgi:hypothetical protein